MPFRFERPDDDDLVALDVYSCCSLCPVVFCHDALGNSLPYVLF